MLIVRIQTSKTLKENSHRSAPLIESQTVSPLVEKMCSLLGNTSIYRMILFSSYSRAKGSVAVLSTLLPAPRLMQSTLLMFHVRKTRRHFLANSHECSTVMDEMHAAAPFGLRNRSEIMFNQGRYTAELRIKSVGSGGSCQLLDFESSSNKRR